MRCGCLRADDGMARRNLTTQLTRRTDLRTGVAGALVAALGSAPRGAWAATSAPADRVEPEAGGWRTWVLESGAELRPPAPRIGRRPGRKSLSSVRLRSSATRQRSTR